MSETIDLGWIGRTLRSVQTEQRALRAMIEPLAPRLAGLEARFSALDAPLGGIESMLDAMFGGIQEQGRMLAERLDAAHRPAGPT